MPANILSLVFFKKYTACQCLIHEKGAKETTSLYSCTNASASTKSIVPAQEFNSIYEIIRRSKNKLFDQSQLLSRHLNIVGVFLAVALDASTHQLIVLLSRNDFLPPSNFEYDTFYRVISSFKKQILAKINEEKQTHRNVILSNAIKILESEPITDKELKSKNYHVRKIELLGELLNTLKHELSNPIFGIKLTAGLLTDKISGDGIDLVNAISSEASRCQSIIDNFSNLYAIKKESSVCDLKSIIKESIIITKSVCREIKRTTTYLNTSGDAQILVNTNRTWIVQILFNFIINAAHELAKVNRDKLIEVIVNILPTSVSISIKDNGNGIPANIVNNIFEPFFTTKERGTGLGLTICEYLATELGGTVRAANNLNEWGACFTLTLPLGTIT